MYTQVRGFGFDYKGTGAGGTVAGGETKREGNERSPFGDFSCSGGEKRVICSNERHKNILCNARTKKREVDVMGNRI